MLVKIHYKLTPWVGEFTPPGGWKLGVKFTPLGFHRVGLEYIWLYYMMGLDGGEGRKRDGELEGTGEYEEWGLGEIRVSMGRTSTLAVIPRSQRSHRHRRRSGMVGEKERLPQCDCICGDQSPVPPLPAHFFVTLSLSLSLSLCALQFSFI